MTYMDYSQIDLKTLACIIYNILKNSGIDTVLVGGACVSIYSNNQYQSYDLDFVTYQELQNVEQVLAKIGFKKQGRYFIHKQCPYLIDFVNPPVAVGNQPVRQFEEMKTNGGSLQLLTATDCVKDRLAAYFYWDDLQSLAQAILVTRQHHIDIANIRKWSEDEKQVPKFEEFERSI